MAEDPLCEERQVDADDECCVLVIFYSIQPWSSLEKEEPLVCQITSQFNNKQGCLKKIALQKQPTLLNEEVIWRASDSTLSKELHNKT